MSNLSGNGMPLAYSPPTSCSVPNQYACFDRGDIRALLRAWHRGADALQARSRLMAVFVAESEESPSLAFEAGHEAQAVTFANASWFTQALSAYAESKRRRLSSQEVTPRIRPATDEETAAYREFAREFADVTDCFLFAPV